MKYCLIGTKLGHSYSEEIHRMNGLDYSLMEVELDNLSNFNKTEYNGFNVTIPFKQEIINYIDKVDDVAKEIGSINTVVNINGRFIGYNTDYIGMINALSYANILIEKKNVLILGSGGTSKTAQYVCKKLKANKIYIVGRTGDINYSNVYSKCFDTNVIINTTPVGMYPNMDESPIDLTLFKNLDSVFDCIYNPIRTKLILDAYKLGLKASGGLYMLCSQALESEKLWGLNSSSCDYIYNKLLKDKENIVLNGMPSCGKTTIGKVFAKKINKKFFDVDKEITKRTGLYSSDIISMLGEESFRQLERDVIKELSINNSCVISLGGGSILNEENVIDLKKNGKFIYVARDLDKLTSKNRPLSSNKGIDKLFNERKDLYIKYADFVVENNSTIEDAVGKVEELYENISN